MCDTSSASLAVEYADVVSHLEELESKERTLLTALPHLKHRAPPIEISDCTSSCPAPSEQVDSEKCVGDTDDASIASIRHQNLRSFSLSLIHPSPSPTLGFFSHLATLDVSNNELAELPGLSKLCNLRRLILSRNWFNTLPSEIGSLQKLHTIDASRNFFRPNAVSLRFDELRSLPELRVLVLSYNQKCGRPHHRDLIESEVPQLNVVKITVWEKICSNPGAYVGASAAERDATLLRAQLEPWGTVQLRRRLVQDFGQEPTDPALVDRAEVMERLLECYRKEGLMDVISPEKEEEDDLNVSNATFDLNSGVGRRRTVRVDGKLVSQVLRDNLLQELRSWLGDRSRGGSLSHRERPSIKAKAYMIMRAPDANDRKLEGQVPEPSMLSRRAQRTAKKMARNEQLWKMAMEAMRDVDPEFAERCTEVAVTYGFSGSPHIDKQNCGPFYGLALGNFSEGNGQVCVECSARVVCKVNTKNRLGRIDGRYPHWVAPYNIEEEERFSLIYYVTGGDFVAPGPAVFSIPLET